MPLNVQLFKVIKSNYYANNTFQSLIAVERIKCGRPMLVACSTGTKVACVALEETGYERNRGTVVTFNFFPYNCDA